MAAPAATAAAAADKETHLMIVKEPLDDDVLLGQGHYRHPGNQKLNKIVDAKVSEYRTQSRPFKTYMAHEIIHSLRSKGVRFLKELASKGSSKGGCCWVEVKDDKEAREKVAQRFQYMMRKTENPFVAKDKSATKKKAKATKAPKRGATEAPASTPKPPSPVAATAAEQSSTPPTHTPLTWNGANAVKIPFLPVFHQLQKTSVMVDDDVNDVFKRLRECFDIIGVQESFNHEQANALLTGQGGHLKIHMNLWKPLGGNRGVIVELVNMESDHQLFKMYSRYITEAATGLFQQYSQKLFQARGLATASVHEHVSAFSSAWATPDNNQHQKKVAPPAKVFSEEGNNPQTGTKPGMVKNPSDRSLQSKRDKPKGVVVVVQESTTKHKNKVKPPTKVLVPGRPDQAKTTDPSHQKERRRQEAPERRAEIVTETECFASAFSRWETGAAAAQSNGQPLPVPRAPPAARRPPTKTVPASSFVPGGLTPHHNDWGPGSAASPQQAKGEGVAVVGQKQSSAKRDHGTANMQSTVGAVVPAKEGAETASEKHQMGEGPTPKKANTLDDSQAGNSACGLAPDFNATTASDTKATSLQSPPEPVERLPTMDPYPLVGWARAASSHQEEMKCDSSVEERLDAEMISLYHATESIKRLSLSSNDASVNEPRTVRGLNDAFPVGLLPIASSQQEMKCDSSLDDGPYDYDEEDRLLTSAQSFLPTSFFGAVNPGALTATLRVPGPPSPAHSLGSRISVEMRSSEPSPSPSPSFASRCSSGIEFSLPSPCGSFNSKCSLGLNSLNHVQMDDSMSPSMFHSDQSAGHDPQPPALGTQPSYDSVPPTIFVEATVSVGGPSVPT